MKKILIIAGSIVGLLVLIALALVASTFMGRSAIVDGFESGPVRVVKDGIVSVALLDTGDGSLALVDAGNDSSGKAILAELARRSMTPAAVKTILLTHAHPDHMGAIHLFPNAEIMALADEVPLAEGLTAGNGPMHWFMSASPTGLKVSRALSDGDMVQLGKLSVRAFAVPGHTAGSAVYLTEGVLIMGDSADMSSSGKLAGSPWLFSENQAANRASLVQLERRLGAEGIEIKAMVFSHSGAISQGLGPLTAYTKELQ
jgi:ribonuclease BN (tRNA processing enzyme)